MIVLRYNKKIIRLKRRGCKYTPNWSIVMTSKKSSSFTKKIGFYNMADNSRSCFISTELLADCVNKGAKVSFRVKLILGLLSLAYL